MKRTVTLVLVFIVGIILGGTGHWLVSDKMPEINAYRQAQQEQAALVEKVHIGTVKAISDDEIILMVAEKAGEKVESEVVSITYNDTTSFQQGMIFIDEPGSIKAHIKPEMTITALVENNEALAIYIDDPEVEEVEMDSVSAIE